MSNDETVRRLAGLAGAMSFQQNNLATFRRAPDGIQPSPFEAVEGFAGYSSFHYHLPGRISVAEFARIVPNAAWLVDWDMTAQVAHDKGETDDCSVILCRAVAQLLIAARPSIREVTLEQAEAICAQEYQRRRQNWLRHQSGGRETFD